MSDTRDRDLADLLRSVGRAHHQAFIDVNGEDPDWALWYARNLREPLASDFGIDIAVSYLVHCLIKAENEHAARAPYTDWAVFYAARFMEHLCADGASGEALALYYFPSCPFCKLVLAEIDELGIDVDRRDIFEDGQHRADLVAARGRATVPVLRITALDGSERWMPESRDIISFLRATYD